MHLQNVSSRLIIQKNLQENPISSRPDYRSDCYWRTYMHKHTTHKMRKEGNMANRQRNKLDGQQMQKHDEKNTSEQVNTSSSERKGNDKNRRNRAGSQHDEIEEHRGLV